jgi:hypothetical protein
MALAVRRNTGSRCGAAAIDRDDRKAQRQGLDRIWPPPRQCGLLSISSRFPLNLIDAAENKEMGRAFHNTICTHEVRFMSSLALREDARQAGEASISISARPASQSKPASASIEGVLLFSGIGFGLMVLAAIFGYLELPPPYF